MNLRGYKANLDVNDREGIIEIKVETHKTVNESPAVIPGGRSGRNSGSASKNDPKKKIMQDLRGNKKYVQKYLKFYFILGLSGGERSYTTAAFVMALWNCMESPFRLLDEFDVFMDMVNRSQNLITFVKNIMIVF